MKRSCGCGFAVKLTSCESTTVGGSSITPRPCTTHPVAFWPQNDFYLSMSERKEQETPQWLSAAALSRARTVGEQDLHDSSDTDGESVGSEEESDDDQSVGSLASFLDEDEKELSDASSSHPKVLSLLATLAQITAECIVDLKPHQLHSFLSQAIRVMDVSVSHGGPVPLDSHADRASCLQLITRFLLRSGSYPPLPPQLQASTSAVITLSALQTLMSSMETTSSSTLSIELSQQLIPSSTHRLWQFTALLGMLKGTASAMLSKLVS